MLFYPPHGSDTDIIYMLAVARDAQRRGDDAAAAQIDDLVTAYHHKVKHGQKTRGTAPATIHAS